MLNLSQRNVCKLARLVSLSLMPPRLRLQIPEFASREVSTGDFCTTEFRCLPILPRGVLLPEPNQFHVSPVPIGNLLSWPSIRMYNLPCRQRMPQYELRLDNPVRAWNLRHVSCRLFNQPVGGKLSVSRALCSLCNCDGPCNNFSRLGTTPRYCSAHSICRRSVSPASGHRSDCITDLSWRIAQFIFLFRCSRIQPIG